MVGRILGKIDRHMQASHAQDFKQGQPNSQGAGDGDLSRRINTKLSPDYVPIQLDKRAACIDTQ